MLKHILAGMALAAALATSVFAQTPGQQPSQKSSPEKFVEKQQATDWRGSKLIGATVYGGDNASIGEINDVLIGNDGAVRAAVISVGGFLGVSEKHVAVPFDALKITGKPDSSSIQKITTSYTKDELKAAPAFAYADALGSTTGSGLTSPGTTSRPAASPPSTGPRGARP